MQACVLLLAVPVIKMVGWCTGWFSNATNKTSQATVGRQWVDDDPPVHDVAKSSGEGRHQE